MTLAQHYITIEMVQYINMNGNNYELQCHHTLEDSQARNELGEECSS